MTRIFIRLFTVLSFVLAIVQLWAASVSAADTHVTTRKLADGSVERCTYTKSLITINGEHVQSTRWVCIRTAR